MCLAQRLRGQGSEERMGGLLDQIWLPGRLMEGSPPAPRLVHRALWLASTSTHVGCKILGAAPPRGHSKRGSFCANVCSLSRGTACALLTSRPPHMVPPTPFLTPLRQPPTLPCRRGPLFLCLPPPGCAPDSTGAFRRRRRLQGKEASGLPDGSLVCTQRGLRD